MKAPQTTKKATQSSQLKEIEETTRYGKIPPQAIELEEAVLGAVMLEQDAIDKVAHLLTPECFYKEEHRIIFKCILELSSRNAAIDLMVVTMHLKEAGLLENVGGPLYVTQLANSVANAVHIEHHARIIYEKYVQRKIIAQMSDIQHAAYEDFDTMYSKFESMIFEIDLLFNGTQTIKHIREVLYKHTEELQRRLERSQTAGVSGIDTGLRSLNLFLLGWQPGTVNIIAARPSMGKTAFALKEAKAAAMAGTSVCFFSLETTDIKLSDRLLCSNGGIDPDHLKSGKLNQIELDAYNKSISQLETMPFYIDDKANVNVSYIRSVCRAKHKKGECGMIVIDYLQLISVPEEQSRFMTREREVGIISRQLKILAKDLDIPILLLCQINRSVESRQDKRPYMSDLRESGAIEQDADVIVFPHRPWVYGIEQDDEGTSFKNILMLIVAKNKDGATGELYFRHSSDMTQIFDLNDPVALNDSKDVF